MKIKKLKFIRHAVVFVFLLSFFIPTYTSGAEYKVVSYTITTFSGNKKTFEISFPPTLNSDAKVEIPKIGANGSTNTIVSAKFDMERKSGVTGTPYIWVPATDKQKLIQLKTSDGSLVHIFERGKDNCTTDDFTAPSRITVIVGGDVWVGNRRDSNKVTRLGIKDGCVENGNSDCYECKDRYDTCGSESKGVTFDSEGNIWVGSHNSSCLVRLCGRSDCVDVNGNGGYSIGDKMAIDASNNTQINSFSVYGLIGDEYGNVWSVDGNTNRINISDTSATPYSTATIKTYGIGMDNTGDIWVGRHDATGIWEIDGGDSGGAGIGVIESSSKCSTVSTITGLAVDGDNNVWGTGYDENSVYVIKEGNCDETFKKTKKKDGTNGVCTWLRPHGMAIDADNHAWLICDSGEIIKYAFHDNGDGVKTDGGDIEELLRIDVCGASGLNIGCSHGYESTYNYSDMTGFRTAYQKLLINSNEYTIVGSTFSGFEADLYAKLLSCTPDISGNCVIPLEISSNLMGDFTLKNLEIVYGTVIPVTTGGIVPCGRNDDDPSTSWKEDEPCTLCSLILMIQLIIEFLVKIAAIFAVLAIVGGGLMYTFSAGNQGTMGTAKTMVKYAIIGFLIVFIAWAAIDSILALVGYIDPLGNEWYIIC